MAEFYRFSKNSSRLRGFFISGEFNDLSVGISCHSAVRGLNYSVHSER